ncbi:MAG: porin [Afipia sp.]
MRIRAKFAKSHASYRYTLAASSFFAALGMLGMGGPARAEDDTFLPSWFTPSALTFKTPPESGAYAAGTIGWPEDTVTSPTRLRIEYLMLRRKGPAETPLTGPNGATRYTPFTSSDLKIGSTISQGFKATVDAELWDTPFEFSAFYSAPFQNDLRRSGLSNGTSGTSIRTHAIYANDPGGGISNYTNSQNIDQMYVNHSSQLFGAEANAKSLFGIPGLVAGVRSFYFGEDLNTVTQKLASTTAIDAVTVQTRNYLVGPQIGFEGMFDIGGGIKVGGSAKAGLYANFVERERSFISRNQTQTRAQQNSISGTAFSQAYELNPRIEVPLMEGVKLSAGGTFLWLNNVSTAFPHYATVTNLQDRDLRAKDRTFFYGLQAGLNVDLDTVAKFSPPPMSRRYIEAKTLETSGPTPIPFTLYGEINRMALSWNDGLQKATRIVDNNTAPTILGARGAVEITRGWTTGFHVEGGLNQARSIEVSQFLPGANSEISPDLRYLDVWLRSNRYGKVTIGHTSTATDGVVLTDLSETNGAASANIAMIGGDLMLRAADALDTGQNSLITRTPISDFVGGATIDTLRRQVVHYETPTLNGFAVSVAAGNRFWDAALSYRADLADWRFRASIGYLRDTNPGIRADLGGRRDRSEWKGGASLLHTPTGLFVTTAFVNRQFRGYDTSNQAVFGENMVDAFGNVIPGTHRPDLRYGYLKTGLRKQFTALGDTKFYAETAIARNSLTGLREGGPKVVTSSQLNMVGAGIMQDIDAYNTQLYLGYRHYSFDIEGLRDSSTFGSIASPAPIKDINLVFSGIRIKF